MTEEERIVFKFPKGIEPTTIAVIIVFGLIVYFLSDTLKSIFAEGLKNPNYAIVVIALILVVLCFLFVYVIRALTKKREQKSVIQTSDLHSVSTLSICFSL
jgi:divalent metal cation (Fe/Co/Zn/Cd) transporter